MSSCKATNANGHNIEAHLLPAWHFDREIDARRFAKRKGITIVETEDAS